MEIWTDGTRRFEVNSYYCLPDNAWTWELIELSDSYDATPRLSVSIPDATPEDGQFVPEDVERVDVLCNNGRVPWRIVRRFIGLIEESGDIRDTTDEH
ncbi:hypothetical protein [Nocardia cyriacigeorgica]|uniref:hypothetical protein n=1 Tax=Nocardia cyriacigeorgica TaxID=135487 RepID=UPI00245571A6|nr:hypothetical protein [Nocardia cyriacigeorgica]